MDPDDDQEVFTDMSVLPLVFPDNMSCFSRGSYKVTMVKMMVKMITTLWHIVIDKWPLIALLKLLWCCCLLVFDCFLFIFLRGNLSNHIMIDDYDAFQEELARKRQLPVPPMPRKGGVVL